MFKDDIYQIQAMVNEYGARITLQGFIAALRQSADQMSDMGLKERAILQADLAEALQKVESALGDDIA